MPNTAENVQNLHDDIDNAEGPDQETETEASNEEHKPTLQERLVEAMQQGSSDIEEAALVAVQDMIDLDKQSSAINSKKQEIRDRMETMGINRHALAAAVKVHKMDGDKMDGYDLSIAILRKAIGKPVQQDLFSN